MKNYIEDKIDIIKENNSFGILIEVGAGCPIYNELTTRPNTASKIVLYAESPNNWQYNNKKYNTEGFRAVSYQTVSNMIYVTNNNRHNANFILASSIQVANDKKTQTHGWIGLMNQTDTKYYHFSINQFMSRKQYNKIIAQIGLDILASHNDVSKLDNGYIDQIIDKDEKQNIKASLTCIINSKLNLKNYHNTSIIFKDGCMFRLNDYLRDNKSLNILKGSFNPVHQHHLDLADKFDNVLFSISIANRDINKKINVDNLVKRIETLNKLGYVVMIDCMVYYSELVSSFRNNSDFNHKINFILGSDIMKRFLDDSGINCTNQNFNINTKFNIKYKNVTFNYSERSGYDSIKICENIKCVKKIEMNDTSLSSTYIRKCFENNELHLLEDKVNNQLIQLYKDIWI